jgi:hypothetical protein
MRNSSFVYCQIPWIYFYAIIKLKCSSLGILSQPHWPRYVRHKLTLSARIRGSWFRIPLEAWMVVSAFILFMLSFVKAEA